MSTQVYFFNPRPLLSVEKLGGRELGRCYYARSYKITSTTPLKRSVIQTLRGAVIDDGQGFAFWQVGEDGSHVEVPEEITWRDRPAPTGTEEVVGTEVDYYTKKPTGNPTDASTKMSYWEYRVEVTVDSSD